MADYSVQMIVSLHVEDTLVGYEPPFGTLPESMRAFARRRLSLRKSCEIESITPPHRRKVQLRLADPRSLEREHLG
jgi:hypothetical protein